MSSGLSFTNNRVRTAEISINADVNSITVSQEVIKCNINKATWAPIMSPILELQLHSPIHPPWDFFGNQFAIRETVPGHTVD